MKTINGTCHFRHAGWANAYYATYGLGKAEVKEKIKDGSIVLGRPNFDNTKFTCSLKDGRYFLTER